MGQLKTGQKLKSAVCNAEVMVIKAGTGADLTCGGVAMLADGGASGEVKADPGQLEGCLIGKRYVNEDQSLEVLCVKAGDGSLALNGAPLSVKDAKKLPSSD